MSLEDANKCIQGWIDELILHLDVRIYIHICIYIHVHLVHHILFENDMSQKGKKNPLQCTYSLIDSLSA